MTKRYVAAPVIAGFREDKSFLYSGDIDCSGYPDYPAGEEGHVYFCSVAGKVGGSSGTPTTAGDMMICLADDTASGNQATVGTSWVVISSAASSVDGPATATDGAMCVFDGTTGKVLKADARLGAALVAGPASTVTDGALCFFDTTTGRLIKQGSALPSNTTAASIDINGGTIDNVTMTGGVIVYWAPAVQTLQALITSITDATATKQYTIMVPPGYIEGATITASSPLLLKPFINLRGAGGAGRVTVFHNVGVSFLDAAMTTGTQRLRLEGIRFETVALILTAASHVMSVAIIDCPINSASSIKFTGTSYAAPSALELRNLNIDNNTTANLYKFCQVSFWNCTLLGLYFQDADAYHFGCDISSGCNMLNTGSAGGWFEFNNCKLDQMTLGSEVSESVLATLGVGGSENIQVHGGPFVGYTAPGSLASLIRFRAGTEYFCTTDFKLYVKTALVGTNTWAVVGSQAT